MAEEMNKAVSEEPVTPEEEIIEEAAAEEMAAEEAAEEPAEEETTPEDDGEAQTAKEQEEPALDKKKGIFKKRKDKKDERIEELTDQLRRQMAEFDNYRKRTDKEKAGMYVVGAREIVEKLLPVVDSFERGLATATQEQLSDPFVDGMNKVYKQMMTAFEEMGVAPIDAVGQPFDPELHNAVMHIEDETLGENVIAEEFQKGYTYKGFVVRHSMVKVAN